MNAYYWYDIWRDLSIKRCLMQGMTVVNKQRHMGFQAFVKLAVLDYEFRAKPITYATLHMLQLSWVVDKKLARASS